MITKLGIQNFKSIKDLNLNCKRINIFIGEPNTGKSNILESIGLLSYGFHSCRDGDIRDFVRFESMKDLFYDHNLGNKIRIKYRIYEAATSVELSVKFKNGTFEGVLGARNGGRDAFQLSYDGTGTRWTSQRLNFFKFYRFVRKQRFSDQRSEFLIPPNGDNLLAIILVNKELKTLLKQLFDRFGLRLVLEPEESKIKVQKQLEDIIIAFPYSLTSETLQRLVFYLTAIYSNQNSTIVFEEPEAHAFPYYTKYLAEIIALDKNKNQFFIATHNPYLLISVLEKTPKDEVNIFVVHFENYQTKVEALTQRGKQRILRMGTDVFLNIEKFLAKRK